MKTPQVPGKHFNILLLPLLAFCIFLFSNCSDQGKEKAQKSLNEFKMYVKEHKESADQYADEKWDEIEREYDQKKAELDKETSKMDREMKESYANTVADWEEFKNNVSAKRMAKQEEKKSEHLKKTFAPEYIMTDMSNINGQNILAVYTHFFDVIEKNKDIYTKEEWKTANDYWVDLNKIRDRLDDNKAISKKDDHKINEIRIKYAATKALNKPFAEGAK